MSDDQVSNSSIGSSMVHDVHSIPRALETHSEAIRKISRNITGETRTSTESKKIAHKDRRGIFAGLCVLPEYEDAREYPIGLKRVIVAVIAFASICGPLGSSIILPAIQDIESNLKTTATIVNFSVGVYLLALGIFPLWWSRLSEKHGRRTVYVVSFSLFCIFCIGCAFAPSISALIILRIFCGGCSASVQAVGAGTIGDLFIPEERGSAMGWYYLGPLMGPFLAPILGGVVSQVWGWRSTQWALVIFSGVAFLLITFLLPETLRRQDNMQAIIKSFLEQSGKTGCNSIELPVISNKEPKDGTELSNIDKTKTTESKDIIPQHSLVSEEIDSIYDDNQSQRLEQLEVARTLSRANTANESFFLEDNNGALMLEGISGTLSRYQTQVSEYSRRLVEQVDAENLEKILTKVKEYQENAKDDAQPAKGRRILSLAYENIIGPTRSIILLSHPPVALVISYSAITFATIYFFNMSISYEYSRPPYNFKPIIVGLLYIPNSVTYLIGSLLGGRWIDRALIKYARTHNGELHPEARISWNVMLAVVLFPPACLIFGWCLKFHKHWVTPLIGSAILGFASMLLIGAITTYLVDSLPGKGATGVALNNLIRQTLAAIATFVVQPLLKAIGPGILFSIIAAVIIIFSPCLIILKRYGTFFRENSKLASLYEKL